MYLSGRSLPASLLLRDDPPPLLTPRFERARFLFRFHIPFFLSRKMMPQP